MSRACPATGCEHAAEPELLMCKKHWNLVPRDIKRDLWQYYYPGQDENFSPQACLDAIDAAIDAVEEAELAAEKAKSEPRPRLGW